ncbi:hypothetical protein JHK87_044896 [Glycine soja]|nr:hypothetical protein JHK87_044896 [Glycine soja]
MDFLLWFLGVKLDCVFGEDLDLDEIIFLLEFFNGLEHPIVFSLLPGVSATPLMANSISSLVNTYRVTGDDWDEWSAILAHFNVARTPSTGKRMFVVGNIHVLFNPNRGDIKLSQSAIYKFLSSSKLSLASPCHGRMEKEFKSIYSPFVPLKIGWNGKKLKPSLLTDLTLLHINTNRFYNTVQHKFDKLKLPFELDLSNNCFVRKFPDVVLCLSQLKFLDMRFNKFKVMDRDFEHKHDQSLVHSVEDNKVNYLLEWEESNCDDIDAEDAGFNDAIAEDRTDQFVNTLQPELEALENKKDDFIGDFSKMGLLHSDYDFILTYV